MARREEDGSGVAVLNRDAATPPTSDTNNGTSTSTGPSTPAAATPAAGTRKPKRNLDDMGPNEAISINVRIPNGLRMKMAETATQQNTSVPQLVAQMLAQAYTYELPKSTRPPRIKKYANAQERIAAQKAAQAKQRTITRALLKAVEEGKINVDVDSLVAQFTANEDAAKASAAANAEATS